MSAYYNARRTRNNYESASTKPFPVSRSKIDLFLECPRCFYMDRRLGVARPPGYPFNLNSAVDALLKKEFDIHRTNQSQHPLMKQYKIDAVPFPHEAIEDWRNNFHGIRYIHEPSNLEVFGAIDDLWHTPAGELIVVDYKATSKNGEVNLDAPWQIAYKRQMEVYQWLFRQNGFNVSSTGYFVYCNGKADREAFDGKLEFDIKVISYVGNDSWIEPTLPEIKRTLERLRLPQSGADCDYCSYIAEVAMANEAD